VDALLLLCEGGAVVVTAVGKAGKDWFTVERMKVEAGVHASVIELDAAIELPAALLELAGEQRYRFITAADAVKLGEEAWSALRAQARAALAKPYSVDLGGGHSLFGVVNAGAQLTAQLSLASAVLDGATGADDAILVVRAHAGANFSYRIGAWQVSGKMRMNLTFHVTRGMLPAVEFDVDLPTIPGFDLRLPRLELPQLKLDGLLLGVPDPWLPSLFHLSVPEAIGKLRFQGTAPTLALTVEKGVLSLSTNAAGEGQIGYDDGGFHPFAEVRQMSVVLGAAGFGFDAQVTPHPLRRTMRVGEIDREWLPFVIDAGEVTVSVDLTIDAGGAALKLTMDVPQLQIRAHDDPELQLTLKLAFEVHATPSGLTTRMTDLQVVQPYPVKLLLATAADVAGAIGQFVRLVGALELPAPGAPDAAPVVALLRHIGRMLAEAVVWLARKTGQGAGLLAGLVEDVVKLLAQLVEAIAQAGAAVYRHVLIEVRIDPKSFALRQLVVRPAGCLDGARTVKLQAPGCDLTLSAASVPALVFDAGSPSWIGLVVPAEQLNATLETDLWLNRASAAPQPLTTLGEPGAAPKRLVSLQIKPGAAAVNTDLVLLAVQDGRLKCFQRVDGARAGGDSISIGALTVAPLARPGRLVNATFEQDVDFDFDPDGLSAVRDKILAMLPKSQPGAEGGLMQKLQQKIRIDKVNYALDPAQRRVNINLQVQIHLDERFAPTTTLTIALDLDDFTASIEGGDRIAIMSDSSEPFKLLGFHLGIEPKECAPMPYQRFLLDLSRGGESFGIGEQAQASLSYDSVGTGGRGLQFTIDELRIGRTGIDLAASIKPDPVVLGGVDVPFKFTSGSVAIKQSRFTGGALTGSGQLPQSLIGEANATIALTLGTEAGEVVVQSATATVDKSGDPIRCTSTNFDLTINELGLDFVREDGYHFYFLVSGSVAFNPSARGLTRGLLKHFGGVEIKLNKAPLAADPRVLMRSISFKVKLDPVKVIKAWDIFTFEWRSFGYHPSCDKFGGDPAISIGGQMMFMEGGDKISARMDFHDMWVSYGKGMPRFRFDGLTVALSLGGVKVEGTAVTVDGSLPSLYKPSVLPANVTANGFLASGRIQFPGWSPLTASMGFLELRKEGKAPRHAFFIYGQREQQTEPIDTPVGRLYLREYGFGFGYRYTVAGIARAERAETPGQLIQILDEVSKFQGSLDQFQAWEPTYENADLTMALRGMLSLAAASSRDSYNAGKEADLPNPLLFDIVAALRTDLTFLISMRGWLAVNYHDWTTAKPGDEWRTNPSMRGYLYFSAPRREFLGRFLSNPTGHIGQHPPLPSHLIDAMRRVTVSATLYVRPGLFHFELGWPYELEARFGQPGEKFHMTLNGGLIHRMEDDSVLYGMAFRAVGAVHLEGRVGSSSFGAAAVARADFALAARILAFLSLRTPGESIFYGELRLDVTVRVSVEVWLSFKVFGHRVRLSHGFALDLSVSLAIEAVISASQGLGGRAHASVGVRAFGRSASVGIGFSFNDGLLASARARVARFMGMGLSADLPPAGQDGARIEHNPPPAAPRSETATIGDDVIDNDLATIPTESEEEPQVEYIGRAIAQTDFWAMLFPTAVPPRQAGTWYILQLVPRDHTSLDGSAPDLALASFFASARGGQAWHKLGANSPHPEWLPAAIGGQIDWGRPAWEAPLATRLNDVIQPGDGTRPDLTLGTMMNGLFLDRDPSKQQFGEPLPRQEEIMVLDSDANAAVRRLAKAGRSRDILRAEARREAQVEEARAAVLAAVCSSASRLAEQGMRDGHWPGRHEEIDARLFGLTFLVSAEAVKKMFPSGADLTAMRRAAFSVIKSDCGKAGQAFLFNPPERMFREAGPTFQPVHAIDEQGIRFDWDLEPAWEQSRGAYHDPEFHLKHYRIVRTIEGIAGKNYRAEFEVTPSRPTQFLARENGMVRMVSMRPPFQFSDSLRKHRRGGSSLPVEDDIPDGIRDVLLGRGSAEEWKKAGGPDPLDGALPGVRILYEIVPVDTAGTSTFGEIALVQGFHVPVEALNSPQGVTLQTSYDDLPVYGAARPPQLLLMVIPAMTLNSDRSQQVHWPEPGNEFDLRILSEPIRSLGAYGTDALEAGARRLDEDAIESLSGDDVADFVVRIVDTAAGEALLTAGLARADDGQDKDSKPRVFSIQSKPAAGAFSKGLRAVAQHLSARAGISHRMFLRQRATDRKYRHGAWRMVTVNLVIANSGVNANVDQFEAPLSLDFQALQGGDLVFERSASGRLHLLQPAPDSSLATLLARPMEALDTVRDPARRSAVQLSWRARPSYLGLRAASQKENTLPRTPAGLERCIGGFDVFVSDPDGVAGLSLEQVARKIGRVKLLPPSLHGLEPSGFGDFALIESAYPSDTLRQKGASAAARSQGVRLAPWFSAADSVAVFPEPAIRRSLLPDPDEDMLAALFANGAPSAIRVSIPAWNGGNADPLAHWQIDVGEAGGKGTLASIDKSAPQATPGAAATRRDKSCIFDAGGGTIRIAQVRDLLQRVCLLPVASEENQAVAQELAALQARLGDSAYLASVGVQIDAAVHVNGQLRVIASGQVQVDLAPSVHPVLLDAMALMSYSTPEAPGKAYRRYSVVPDATPAVKAASFAEWLDEAPPERDPHGWGALRTLGLAAGLRLYDIDTADYLKGKALLTVVHAALRRALQRYHGARFNGDPFVDLLAEPWGNARLFWFDGGQRDPGAREVGALLQNDLLAVVQIALRPAPDRFRIEAAQAPVAYYALRRNVPSDGDGASQVILRPAADGARYFDADVLRPAAGLEANHPERVKGETSLTLPLGTGADIAIVRAIRKRGGLSGSPSDQLMQDLGLAAAFTLVPLDPAILDGNTNDPAYGKFAALDASDWADALFRPGAAADGQQMPLEPLAQYQDLAYYAGRRFKPVAVKQGVLAGGVEAEDAVLQRRGLAAATSRFWLRFIEHCASRRSAQDTAYFSLGCVADPGEWRCAPDARGEVRITIPEPDRRGARRKYAVLPYGRHLDWSAQREVEPSLIGAVSKQGRHYIDITLPRTEPVEKPVILHARRLSDAGRAGQLQLAIAHGSDMLLAQSNTVNAARMAALDVSVGFLREFPHADWLARLAPFDSASTFAPLAAFGDIGTVPDSTFGGTLAEGAESSLAQLREHVPDAWLGTTVVTAVPPPYFFRVHAQVFASAGVVVSEPVGAQFGEGPARLGMPWQLEYRGGACAPRQPCYWLALDAAGGLQLRVRWPLLRLIDCMTKADAEMWFGPAGEHYLDFKPVAHLPEPSVSYRLNVETAQQHGKVMELLARQGEIDVLPHIVAPGEAVAPPYLAADSGNRLRQVAAPLALAVDGNVWELTLAAGFAAAALPTGWMQPLDTEAELEAALQAFGQAQGARATVRPLDVLLSVSVTPSGPVDAAQLATLRAALSAANGAPIAPEATETLGLWEQLAPRPALLVLLVPNDLRGPVHEALGAIGEVVWNSDAGTLALRRLPTDDELERLGSAAPELVQALYRKGTDRLFGASRRLSLTVMRGDLTPVCVVIERKPLK